MEEAVGLVSGAPAVAGGLGRVVGPSVGVAVRPFLMVSPPTAGECRRIAHSSFGPWRHWYIFFEAVNVPEHLKPSLRQNRSCFHGRRRILGRI